MRLDGNGARDDLLAHPLERERIIVQLHPEPGMGIHDGSILEILEQLLLCRHRALELDLHPGAVNPVPVDRLLRDDVRFIGLDLDLDLEFVRRLLMAGTGDHNRRDTTGQLRIEHSSRDPDTLLPARLPDLVEPGTVEQFAKHVRHLRRDDSRAIVLNDNPEDIAGDFFDADKNIRKHLRLFAGIQRIVHRLFYGGDDTARGGIESQQVFVLLEKFRDTDAALLLGELVSEDQTLSPQQWLLQDRPSSVRQLSGFLT